MARPFHHLRIGWAAFGLALVAAASGGCTRKVSDKDLKIASIAEVRSMLAKRTSDERSVVLIDARSPRAHAEAHIPDSRNIPLASVPEGQKKSPELERYRALVVYGDHPGSVLARGLAKRLYRNGYDNVYWFAGGLKEWRSLGYPIATATGEGAGSD